MRHVANDRWTARFPLRTLGVHQYVVEAWKDVFDTYVDELAKKHAAGVADRARAAGRQRPGPRRRRAQQAPAGRC